MTVAALCDLAVGLHPRIARASSQKLSSNRPCG